MSSAPADDRILKTWAGVARPGTDAFMRAKDIHKQMTDWRWMKTWLYAITGREFTDAQVQLMEAVWVYTSYPDARLWNNRVVAQAASARTTPSLAMAAGISSSEAYVFGRQVDKQVHEFLQRVVRTGAQGEDLEHLLDEEQKTHGRVAGYGRPLNSVDERMGPLKAMARSLGIPEGPHERAVDVVGVALQQRKKRMAPNYAALAAAVAADLGLSSDEYVLFLTIAFVAGMAPCRVEWVGKPDNAFMPVRVDDLRYTGRAPRTLSPG
jgi:citrate synthase